MSAWLALWVGFGGKGTYATMDFLFRGLDEDETCAIAHLERG